MIGNLESPDHSLEIPQIVERFHFFLMVKSCQGYWKTQSVTVDLLLVDLNCFIKFPVRAKHC